MVEILEEWMVHHKKMYEAHVAEQERLINLLLNCRPETTKEREAGLDSSRQQDGEGADIWSEVRSPSADSPPQELSTWSSRLQGATRPAKAPSRPVQPLTPDVDPEGPELACKPKDQSAAEIQPDEEDADQLLNMWTKCSGLHTVSKWVTNYRKHPAGWGALLMIHGIPEVSARLRSKVDNYAIYAALFLSMSMTLVTDAPNSINRECEGDWECRISKRLYFLGFGVGTAAHMLCILLGMGFNNALNEAARDSDVYRMFARGKGFVATVKCERAFVLGCAADFIALVVALATYTSWAEAIAGAVIMAAVVLYVNVRTTRLLFRNGSICQYWRPELGGKPDADDPYDLQVATDLFQQRVRFNNLFQTLREGTLDHASSQEMRKELRQHAHHAADQGQSHDTARSVAVAGIF